MNKLFLNIKLQLFASQEPAEGANTGEIANSREVYDSKDYEEETEEQEQEEEVEISEGSEGESGNREVANPAPEKGGQDEKVNSAFAKIRREKEALENQVKELDSWVEKNFGGAYGVKTWAEYKEAMESQLRDEKRREWEEKGYDPDVIQEIIKNDPAYQAAIQQAEKGKKMEADNALKEGYEELVAEYPDMVTQPEDIDGATWELYEKGYSLKDAFLIANKDKIISSARESAKQRAVNNIRGKSHVKADNTSRAGDDIVVPADVIKMYKAMSPGITMAEIKKDYAEFNK